MADAEPAQDFDIYNESAAEEYLEDDEIAAYEEGFMLGYLAS